VSEQSTHAVTDLLGRWRGGDNEALQQLLPLLYRELRQVAHRHWHNEQFGVTLQSTALVHEAYLRLVDQRPAFVENRSHFVAIASRLMRQILVDHAREKRAAKRDWGLRIEFDGVLNRPAEHDVDVIALDDALTVLATLDARQCQIVELRFFGGLSIEDTARVLEISPATVKREWSTARIWLTRELGGTPTA
jgi:RNA polymerase sigma factor (TIGR02999 family)